MITIKHIDKTVCHALRELLSNWLDSITIIYDEMANLYNIEIGNDVPIMIKYWNGMDDATVYLHLGGRIIAITNAEVLIQ